MTRQRNLGKVGLRGEFLAVSDHLLTEISTWAEVAILLFMVWEKYGPSILGKTAIIPEAAFPQKGFWRAAWNNRTLIVAILGLVFIGWLYLGRGPSETRNSYTELPVSDGNARLDFWDWQKSYDKKTNQAFVNAYLVNDSKVSALKTRHLGVVLLMDSPSVSEKQAFTVFLMLQAQLTATKSPPETDIYPGQKSIWFSVWGPQISATELKKLDDGKIYPVVMNLLRYTDQTVPEGKFIYTQSCIILKKNNVVAFCDGNHNRTYIAD
jgi:hypothetical protein